MIKQKFTILGPSGVGKTSLMATMYDNVKEMFNGTLLSIKPSSDSNQRIKRAVAEMNAALSPDAEFEPRPGSSEAIEYSFSIGMSDNYYIECAFRDFPGGWLSDNIDKFESEIKPWLNESQVLILPVDASMIMQYNKKDKKQKEAVLNLCEIYQLEQVIGDWAKRKKEQNSFARIFVVPLKCETYINDVNKKQLMYQQVNEIYKPIFESLNKNIGYYDAYYCPVDTYGCVKYQKCRWEPNAIGGITYKPTFVCDSIENPRRMPKGADDIFVSMLQLFIYTQIFESKKEFEEIKANNNFSLFLADVLPSIFVPDSWIKIQQKRDKLIKELYALGGNGKSFLGELSNFLKDKENKTSRLERFQI